MDEQSIILQAFDKAALEFHLTHPPQKASVTGQAPLLHTSNNTNRIFPGSLVILGRKQALCEALVPAALRGETNLVLFADGSAWVPNDPILTKNQRRTKTRMAAAVVYRGPSGDEWAIKSFSVPPNGLRNSTERAELAAIAAALAVAAMKVTRLRNGVAECPSTRKVTIFTDCQAALGTFKSAKAMLKPISEVHKIIMRSRFLQRRGVDVELRWCPGHAGIEPHDLADNAAKTELKRQLSTRDEISPEHIILNDAYTEYRTMKPKTLRQQTRSNKSINKAKRRALRKELRAKQAFIQKLFDSTTNAKPASDPKPMLKIGTGNEQRQGHSIMSKNETSTLTKAVRIDQALGARKHETEAPKAVASKEGISAKMGGDGESTAVHDKDGVQI